MSQQYYDSQPYYGADPYGDQGYAAVDATHLPQSYAPPADFPVQSYPTHTYSDAQPQDYAYPATDHGGYRAEQGGYITDQSGYPTQPFPSQQEMMPSAENFIPPNPFGDGSLQFASAGYPAASYGAPTAAEYGAQMYGYSAEMNEASDQQFYVQSSVKAGAERQSGNVGGGMVGANGTGGQQNKRKRPYQEEPTADEEIDGYLMSVESSLNSSTTNTPATKAAENPMCLQDRLSALAQDKAETVEFEAGEDPVLQSKVAQLGPLPKKAKIITQQLDPSIFQAKRKSRFDITPMVQGRNPFATGANTIPIGKTPTMVLNKYSISSSLASNKRNPKKAALVGLKRREDGTIIIPENTCDTDISIQRAIMQQLVCMIEFKFTIGVNKLYNGVKRNQKNKKKDDPMKLDHELSLEELLVYCEEMNHLVRVKKNRFIKLLPHITPYIRAGVNLWAMFHGRGTRRIIRDNWVHWIGPVTPDMLGFDWSFFFLLVRSCYMSQDRRQRSKYRSKFKGVERYIIQNAMWAPNKSVKFEKLWRELKCTFAIKKVAQTLVNWKKVIKYAIGTIQFLVVEPGEFIAFHPKLRQLLSGIENFIDPQVGKVTFDNIDDFEERLKFYCMQHGGYDWTKWGLSLRTLIKLYNCMNTSIHRPDMFSKRPDVRVAFSKILRKGFQEMVLPIQETKLGEATVPAMVKRELSKNRRRGEKKAEKIAELKKAAAEKAVEEAQKLAEEEAKKAEEEKRKQEEEQKRKEENLPTNEEIMFELAGVPVPKPVELQITVDNEPVVVEQSYSDVEVSEDDEDYFHFEPVYTYTQYVQPISTETLYHIPGGTHLEDEIKLRVENQPLTPGQGYGLALSDSTSSVLFVFYPYGHTMRSSHFTNEKHHHRIYGDFRAAKLSLFQFTVKIKRNRFEVFTDGLCIKTVPAYMNTVGITTVMATGDSMPFVNFRVRRVSPEVPVLPYLIKRRHQKGLLVSIHRHPSLGIITKIGKISGNIQMFISHLQDMLTSEELEVEHAPGGEAPKKTPQISVVNQKCVWVVGHHKKQILSWLKCVGF